ncbi:MAG: hypothetical protein AAF125_14925, partial [Chloroflexota bacterium]
EANMDIVEDQTILYAIMQLNSEYKGAPIPSSPFELVITSQTHSKAYDLESLRQKALLMGHAVKAAKYYDRTIDKLGKVYTHAEVAWMSVGPPAGAEYPNPPVMLDDYLR